MKRVLALVLSFVAAPVLAGASAAAFDPSEKITLDLKDARIADVATTLGALAGLPVYVDPDVDGTVTLQVEAMPYTDVLKLISKNTGVWLRIEGGSKLVASRSKDSFFAAVTAPEKVRDAPRIPIAEVRQATASLPPLFIRTRWNGIESCARLEFPEGERPTISVPLSEDPSAPILYVTQFDVDPVSKKRYIALDGAMRGVLPVGGQFTSTREIKNDTGRIFVLVTDRALEPCKPQAQRDEPPQRDVQVSFLARESGPDGPGRLLMSPNLSVRAGTTVKARSGGQDAESGQQRELVLAAYVSRDGTWVAVVMTATAIWVDPRDGGEYYYTQPSEVAGGEPSLFGRDSRLVATLPPGAATPKGIELMLVGREEKPTATDRQ
jgi:hypothetical protein